MQNDPMDFEITEAKRIGAPPLISIWGPSSSGKTMTALKVARGYVGPKGKIGVIDTENKRALLHADIALGEDGARWLHLDLSPPFTPDRYRSAWDALIKAGCDIVIIDSGSHVWEGEGGVLDAAEKATSSYGKPLTGLIKWKAPKQNFKRMVNALLRSPIPVIWCLRSKKSYRQATNEKGRKEVVCEGIEPISGGDLIYEMTVSIMLGLDHKPAFDRNEDIMHAAPHIPQVKAPDTVYPLIKKDEFLGEKFGADLSKWVSSGATFDEDKAKLKQSATDLAHTGMANLERFFKGLTKEEQIMIKPDLDGLKKFAQDADDLQNASEQTSEEP